MFLRKKHSNSHVGSEHATDDAPSTEDGSPSGFVLGRAAPQVPSSSFTATTSDSDQIGVERDDNASDKATTFDPTTSFTQRPQSDTGWSAVDETSSVAQGRRSTITQEDASNRPHDGTSQPSPAMAIHGPKVGTSRESAELLQPSGDEDYAAQFSSSPTKRSSRLGATLSKLHFRSSSGAGKRDSGGGGGGGDASAGDGTGTITLASGTHSRKSMDPGEVVFSGVDKDSCAGHGLFQGMSRKAEGGKGGSGKHTPVARDATGDFAEFLEAEELKAALKREQEEEMKRELKATKNAKKRRDGGAGPYAGHGLGGKGKPESPEERYQRRIARSKHGEEFVPDGPTLEQRGYFPGDLLHHGHLAARQSDQPHTGKRTASDGTLPTHKARRVRPPGICGPVSDTSEEDDDIGEDETDDDLAKSPNVEAGSRRRRGSHSSLSSGASSSSTIAEPHTAATAARDLNASVMSLKSVGSEDTTNSLVSGGANPKLAKPLLELEELELDSFLKNFGRHTREVRVAHSANFPRRRMPQWEDFKIPPGEDALAAAQGKRVTVLTHVDRGLRALEAAEGEGVPLPRDAEADRSRRQSRDKKRKDKKWNGKGTSASNSEAEDGNRPDYLRPGTSQSQIGGFSVSSYPSKSEFGRENTSENSRPSSPHQQRVSWAPDVIKDKTPISDKIKAPFEQRDSLELPVGGLRKAHVDKDEKLAKEQERERASRNGTKAGSTTALWRGPDDVDNIHADEVEYRPSRDEASLGEDEWELLHDQTPNVAANTADVVVNDDSQVDGIAWAIAYILATIERYAPEELDNSPDTTYRESKTRSHVERLYLIAPFWERLLFGIRRVYRWDNPRRTSSIMMMYFTLWYMNLLSTTFFLILIYYTCQFRFFPPSASYLHEQVRARMARGVDADRLAERLRRRSRLDILELYKRYVAAYGSGTQIACGDVADFHEKVKNLILWRDPKATWRTLTLLGITTVFVTLASAHVIWKTVTGFLGFTFFILLPLQSHYPRFRRPLSPIWWALWGSPTDQQFAIELLRRRHLERQRLKHPPTSGEKTSDAAGRNKEARSVGGTEAEGKSTAGDSQRGGGLKHRLIQRSAAAQAVAFGALRPFRSSSNVNGDSAGEKLLDLQDFRVLKDGEVESRPRKLGSFFCQHHGVPGHLHVTTRMLYFVALHSHATPGHGKSGHRTCKTPLQDVSGLVKTKSIKLLVWSSSGLQILRRNKGSLFFSNMPHRDNAFNLLLAIGSEVWHEHE